MQSWLSQVEQTARSNTGFWSGPMLMAFLGQAGRQLPQAVQRFSRYMRIGLRLRPSGLQHHRQARGHPFRKTVVRVPGPSCTECAWISKISPLGRLSTASSFCTTIPLRRDATGPAAGGGRDPRRFQLLRVLYAFVDVLATGERTSGAATVE